MKILGYSERGLINSLLYAVRHSQEPDTLMSGLMEKTHWPCRSDTTGPFDHCSLVLIEQSFSEFGTADAVILFGEDRGPVVFLEAKRGPQFRLADEWSRFANACGQRSGLTGITSNVFCQLYLKQRMIDAIANPAAGGDIVAGLPFAAPLAPPGRHRKIGENSVVRKAVRRIAPHAKEAYFVMMVPEPPDVVEDCWQGTLCPSGVTTHGCDFSRWGFLSIWDIETFCERFGLTETLDVFRFNEGQLY